MSTKQASLFAQDVHKRAVFYLPGYDPMLPRRYRELYRTEGALQAKISGYDLAIKGKTGNDNYSWSAVSDIGGKETQCEIEFLLWSDIVSDSMERSIPGTFWLLARTVWIYLRTGALLRLMRLRKGPIYAALYPVFMLLAQLLLSAAIGGLIAVGINVFAPAWVGFIAGMWVLGRLMMWFKSKDNKLFAYYLLHDYAYSAQYLGANPPELEARMAEFGEQIFTALQSDVDEVLIVGHSSGAHLGVSVLSDLLRKHSLDPKGPKLAFLTLGQVVPMVSFLPNAHRLRADLQYLCQRDEITWIDVTAPGDGCSFALCDPVSVSGAAPQTGKKWPLVISAAFTQSLKPATFKRLRWRFFRLHFQYLCAFDQPKDYDYFQITAGPVSLRERYRNRVPSRSRIEVAHSSYQSLRAAQ